MLTAAELEQCRRAFLVFDRNSDGVIDASELKASLVQLGHPEPSSAEVAVLMKDFDPDHSGGIDFEEFKKVIERQKGQQLSRGDDADTLEAFVALGGNPDRSGGVLVERLCRTLAEFELRVDLEALLQEAELEGEEALGFEHFTRLLAA